MGAIRGRGWGAGPSGWRRYSAERSREGGGSCAGSREQGQVAQRRVANGPVGLGVAPERGSGGRLDPLRGRGAEHSPAGPGLPGTLERHLHAVEGPREGAGWGRGQARREERPEGGGLTGRAPAALAPRPGSRSFRIRAWMATWAAACEVREGAAPSTLGFAWEGARHSHCRLSERHNGGVFL